MKIIKNFLSDSLFDDLKQKFDIIDEKRSHDDMEAGLYYSCLRLHGKEVKYGPTLMDPIFLDTLETELKSKLPRCNSISVQFCLWDYDSELQMHYDSPYKFGATLYINNWTEEWGGLFQWKDKRCKTLRSYCPEKNSLILNDIDEEHMVSKIISNKETRKCLQIWGK